MYYHGLEDPTGSDPSTSLRPHPLPLSSAATTLRTVNQMPYSNVGLPPYPETSPLSTKAGSFHYLDLSLDLLKLMFFDHPNLESSPPLPH